VYSLEKEQYHLITDFGAGPVWLSDSRRLFFVSEDRLFLADTNSSDYHELLTIASELSPMSGICLSRDDRVIYYSPLEEQADIWVLTLNEES
jgi:hypothetical protein